MTATNFIRIHYNIAQFVYSTINLVNPFLNFDKDFLFI